MSKRKNIIDISSFEQKINRELEIIKKQSSVKEGEKQKGERNDAIAISPFLKARFKEVCAKRNLKMKDVIEEYIKTLLSLDFLIWTYNFQIC